MCCCSRAEWKREVVPDHKFDFIDVREFHATNCMTRFFYSWMWTLFAKSIAVYIADIYTAIALLASNRWAGSILQEAADTESKVLEVPFEIGKWIFTACIIVSFLLLAWEARKARAIIKSRDISYAFTNVMSQHWYSLRSYDHFCFFQQIDNSKKKKDELAFFVFFTFKGWKRLLLADAPRQVVNGITLYSFGKSENWTTDLSVYFGGGLLKAGVIITMLFTLIMWACSALLLLVAAVMYVPLLCYIQGNLKEYCCHKADKRIAELMKRKNRKRLAKEAEIARREAKGDYSHLKDKKTGKLTAAPLPQPTLPKVGLSTADLYASRAGGGGSSEAGSIRRQHHHQYPPLGQPAPLMSRNAYPYNYSEPDSLHKAGGSYADSHSVTSMDAFTARGGYEYADSSTNLVAPGMHRLPSYRSEGGQSAKEKYGNDDGASAVGGTGDWDDMNYVPSLSQHGHAVPTYRSPSTAPTLAPPPVDEYRAPSRQQLYERAARQQQRDEQPTHTHQMSQDSSLSYRDEQASTWEESGSRYELPSQHGHGGTWGQSQYPSTRQLVGHAGGGGGGGSGYRGHEAHAYEERLQMDAAGQNEGYSSRQPTAERDHRWR